jgi:hypothetical protein
MRDSDVRRAVRTILRNRHAGDPDTLIVEEMGVWSGSVRIDIAVINGELSGFELKSDRDTLSRLPTQADIYSRVFDRIDLVVGSRHAAKAEQHIPDWWGILEASEDGSAVNIIQKRPGNLNPSPDPFLIAQLLWRDEVLAVLESFGLANGWRSKKVRLLHCRLAEELSLEQLKASVRCMLKKRKEWLRQPASDEFDVPIDADLHPSF